jgi:hypothetical protein
MQAQSVSTKINQTGGASEHQSNELMQIAISSNTVVIIRLSQSYNPFQ